MFGSQTFDAVGFDSTWKSEKDSQNESSQTTEFSVRDQGTSTAKSISIQTQTENVKASNISESVDMNKLAVWLNSVCPNMLNELNDMSISTAMSSLNMKDDSLVVTASMLQQLNICNEHKDEVRTYKDTMVNFYVSALSWNSTGNTLAVACCYTHENWCYHQGLVNLYTFNRDDVLPSTPTKKLVCGACVATISFHPTLPSVICAGTISGEVLLWNNQSDDGDGLIASIAAHDDRITLISWISNIDSKKQSFVLASTGLDSCLILWDVSVEDSILKIKQKYTTGKTNKVVTSADAYSSKKSEKGIVQFDFSPHVSGLFVLGLEGGALVKCSLLGAKPLTNTPDASPLLDPSVSCYEKHEGEISSIQFSPHRNDLFLSCGSDNEIRIYNIDQSTPVQIIFMDITLNSVSWIMHEGKLLVGCGENGSIRLYSLLNGQLIPNTTSAVAQPLTKLAINKRRAGIAAFGNIKGQVQLWSVPWNNIAAQDCANMYGK